MNIDVGTVLLEPFDGIFGNQFTIKKIDSFEVFNQFDVIEDSIGYQRAIVQFENTKTVFMRVT